MELSKPPLSIEDVHQMLGARDVAIFQQSQEISKLKAELQTLKSEKPGPKLVEMPAGG